jgi:GNAT superfamily N-acetyltransferase
MLGGPLRTPADWIQRFVSNVRTWGQGQSGRPPKAWANCELEIALEPNEDDERMVREAIYAENRLKAGDQHYERLSIFLRDPRGQLVGGVIGSTYWGWLVTDFMWVAEDLRGRGYGTQLLLAGEQEAQRRGCEHACLDTFSFQAKAFYEKLGYVVFGVLDAFPGEHKRYFLKKELRV